MTLQINTLGLENLLVLSRLSYASAVTSVALPLSTG